VQAKLYTIDERLAKFQAMLLDLQARQRKEHSPGPPPSRHPQTSSFRQRGEQSFTGSATRRPRSAAAGVHLRSN
jgi:hypothetical protein